MNGVAAEVAKEVAVLFEHHNRDAGTREEVANHHAGRSPADDGARGRQFSSHPARSVPRSDSAWVGLAPFIFGKPQGRETVKTCAADAIARGYKTEAIRRSCSGGSGRSCSAQKRPIEGV